MADTYIRPQAGPQTAATKCKADILVVGGSAGVGKSWLQAYLAARHYRVKGYNACLMRRTFPMLTGSGSLHDECTGLYAALGARATQRPLEFTWSSPSRVELRPLQHVHSAQEYRSKQFAYLGWDEATEFEGSQFTFMTSRVRSTCGVKTQFVLTTNPDPDAYLRQWVGWWLNSDGYPDQAKAGKTRFFVRVKDEVVWHDDREALVKYVDTPQEVMSFCFIPGLIYDNKILLEKDPSYLAKLKGLPDVERDRYLGGNWFRREAAGDYFQKSAFKIWGATDLQRTLMYQDGRAAEIVQSVRCWDFASTPVTGDLVPGVERSGEFKARDPKMHDPDWTCSVLLGRTRNGRLIILDATFHRDTPGAVQAFVERKAIEDGPRVTVAIFSDPGQAGVDQAEKVKRRIAKHTRCDVIDTLNKEMNAREPARAAWRGEMFYLEGPWCNRFFNQLEDFPTPKVKDDAVVALSGGYKWMQDNPAPFFAYENPEQTAKDAIWLPPNIKMDQFSKKERVGRGAAIVPIGSSRMGWRRGDW